MRYKNNCEEYLSRKETPSTIKTEWFSNLRKCSQMKIILAKI